MGVEVLVDCATCGNDIDPDTYNMHCDECYDNPNIYTYRKDEYYDEGYAGEQLYPDE